MLLKGILYSEAPIYRGNARKTLFTRDGDGSHRLVSLSGEISGTAQALMDAFIGKSKNGKNIGLLNELWQRLYGAPMPEGLIQRVDCKLQESSYPRDNFFDLRMGIKLDEDRWAAEANANYKMETVLRHSAFDFTMSVNESLLKKNGNDGRLYHLLEEIGAGRFWFGAGKSKGLGRLRLEMTPPFSAPDSPPEIRPEANHLRIDIAFDAANPVLVGWNWGKVDPHTPAFAAVEGRQLIGAMKEIPEPIKERLEMAVGGAMVDPEEWKGQFADYLTRITAVWLKERSSRTETAYVLPESAISKLGKGKHALQKKLLNKIKPFAEQPFPSEAAADEAFREALGKKANMAKRVTDLLEHTEGTRKDLDPEAWKAVSDWLRPEPGLAERLAGKIDDEEALMAEFSPEIQRALPKLFQQVDQQLKLLQSDAWVEEEIRVREEHMEIKVLLKEGKITEYQWTDPGMNPDGIRPSTWREFLEAHSRVQYRHMQHPGNLEKSINNDRNHIAFLKSHRNKVRQELTQPHHIDFRAGGPFNREIAKKYGKPYDTLFMRMLSWAPSRSKESAWEIYVPGSTVKGAFRKRASQALKTLWGDTRKTKEMLEHLFGAQGRRGMAFFSDAYLADPAETDAAWCSADGVKMDPKTGQPIETAKRDYLFAYGESLRFNLRIDMTDIAPSDLEALSVLLHILRDARRGDVPIGGDKTSGFGWTEMKVEKLTWLTGGSPGVAEMLFTGHTPAPSGIWREIALTGEDAARALTPSTAIPAGGGSTDAPPTADQGFISHRNFGGHCGTLSVEAELLTPMNIRESGEPTFRTELDDGPVNGWDFFSFSPPTADKRGADRVYALPSRSLKGMIRHIYAAAADARKESDGLGRLNPADRLFGWVGDGPNQALMGRLAFGFGTFSAISGEPAWFKVPYPYGGWRFEGGQWRQAGKGPATTHRVADHWRIFPHAPLAPAAARLDGFNPDTVQASYFRALMPGEKARFTIRFWNLTDEELKRLIWSVELEENLAHKMGNNRYLGFGSVKLRLLEESFLIDWSKRYAGGEAEQWRQPLAPERFRDPTVIHHHADLKKVLDAGTL